MPVQVEQAVKRLHAFVSIGNDLSKRYVGRLGRMPGDAATDRALASHLVRIDVLASSVTAMKRSFECGGVEIGSDLTQLLVRPCCRLPCIPPPPSQHAHAWSCVVLCNAVALTCVTLSAYAGRTCILRWPGWAGFVLSPAQRPVPAARSARGAPTLPRSFFLSSPVLAPGPWCCCARPPASPARRRPLSCSPRCRLCSPAVLPPGGISKGTIELCV